MHFADYKTILSPQNGMNVYRGCTHGCIYCDSRSTCYQMDHDFEDIRIKRDADKILDIQLKKRRKKSMISTGAMTDPYLHLEMKYEVTRKCLEVIEKNGFGVTLLTKSDRVLRDLDLLKTINKKTKAVVQMTLTIYDDELSQIVEPHVSTTKERISALHILKKEGIPTVVWLGPFLPYINDDEENLIAILDECIKARIKGIICFGFGMTLRDGNRQYYYEKLDRYFPGLKEKYQRNYGNSYNIGSPNRTKLANILKQTCIKNGILLNKETFEYLGKFDNAVTATQMTLF